MRTLLSCCLFALLALAGCDGSSPGGNGNGQGGACDKLARDVCLMTAGCILDHRGTPDSYVCRTAENNCELLTNNGGQSACEGTAGCTWKQGSCYCPEGMICFCSGGPAPMCRKS